jgi:hypothetical protein
MNITSAKYIYDNDTKNCIVAIIDNKEHAIPIDEANRHYQEILEWVENGGVIVDNGA